MSQNSETMFLTYQNSLLLLLAIHVFCWLAY